MNKFEKIETFIRGHFGTEDFIPLHEPRFGETEKEYLSQVIDSTFVSYLGDFVPKVEKQIKNLTGSKYCITISNGTSALHMALLGAGVEAEQEVLTQGLSFVATANAITYCDAKPVFLDIDRESLGLSFQDLKSFLETSVSVENGKAKNKSTGKIIGACVPVHIFGHPCKDIEKIVEICHKHHIPVVEDSAESLGSYFNGKHTGTFGDVGIFSFNGNKVVTCGGGGAVITDNGEIYEKIKHISTTAKLPHKWEYKHDQVGFNVRMPNLNAALASAQLERLDEFLKDKRILAEKYTELFKDLDIEFLQEPEGGQSNYWLNAIILKDKNERDEFLENLNSKGIMSRPAWEPLAFLPPYSDSQKSKLDNVTWYAERVINIPSSARKI